jgi:secreted trypsin-like serine protease
LKAFVAALALAAGLTCGTAQAATVKPAIVGGTSNVTIQSFPFQTELWSTSAPNADFGFFCGGVILDATHIATAAHCVLNPDTGQAFPPSAINVRAGTNDVTDTASGLDHAVAVTSFDPNYDPSANDFDVGVLTLAAPLWSGPDPTPNGTTVKIAKIKLVTTMPANNTNAKVSGWGDTKAEAVGSDGEDGTPSQILKSANLSVVGPAQCAGSYAITGLAITPRMLCASSFPDDAGFGDSGGPLVVGSAPANYLLAGLVESGLGCAVPQPDNFPGIYDNVADADMTAFLKSNPPQAPQLQSDPQLVGDAQPGHAVTCTPGGWTGSPTFLFQFARDLGSGRASALTQPSTQNTYLVQQGDVGAQIFCVVEATNAGGYGFDASRNVTGFVTTTHTTTVVDSARPTLRIARRSCSSSGRCVINMQVADALPSSGIARVDAKLRWRAVVRCRTRKSGHCNRMKTKTLHAKAIGGGHYLVTVTRLKPGTYTLLLTAFDKAGNKQRQPTRATLRVKKRRR